MSSISHKYRIRSEFCTIVLVYFVEQLREIYIEKAENHWELIEVLKLITEGREDTIKNLQSFGIKVRELKVNTQQQKIALWCELYKQSFGYNYKVNTTEASAIKNADVTVELINLFFDLNEWWSKEKTISRYAKNINEIKRIYAGKAKQTTGSGNSGTQSSRRNLAKEFQRRYGDTKQQDNN